VRRGALRVPNRFFLILVILSLFVRIVSVISENTKDVKIGQAN